MNVYRVEIKLCGSAYIKAESEEEAMKLLHENYGRNEKQWEGVDVQVEASSRSLDDPRLPYVSLSPHMTAYGPWTPDDPDIEVVETDVPDSEEDV